MTSIRGLCLYWAALSEYIYDYMTVKDLGQYNIILCSGICFVVGAMFVGAAEGKKLKVVLW